MQVDDTIFSYPTYNTLSNSVRKLIRSKFSSKVENISVLCIVIARNANLSKFEVLRYQLESENIDIDIITFNMDDSIATSAKHISEYHVDRVLMLQKLFIEHHRVTDYVLVADDDVVFFEGGIKSSLGIVNEFDFDICSVSHSLNSYRNHNITLQQLDLIASEVLFCEIGPMLFVKSKFFLDFFPSWHIGMGWGLEAFWTKLASVNSLRMGMIHLDSISHLVQSKGFNKFFDKSYFMLNQDYYEELSISPEKFIVQKFMI